MDKERCEVQYLGRVQGVGFRYTVRQIAAGRNVAGFVQNRPDGTVQLVVEGPPTEIDGLLEEVQSAFGGYIRGKREQRSPARGEFHDFRIRY